MPPAASGWSRLPPTTTLAWPGTRRCARRRGRRLTAGVGAGAARLIVGSRPVHSELEAELASWKGAERALLFPTGFAANLAVLATFGPEALICSDQLNHASIIDGCRLARARAAVYPTAISTPSCAAARRPRALVVSETVFSMDGDLAPVEELVTCAGHGALLVIDEAHAVLGPHPELAGVEALRGHSVEDARCPRRVRRRAGAADRAPAQPRPLVHLHHRYAPGVAAAALAALRIVRSAEGEALRERLRGHIERLAPGHPSAILPVIIGEAEGALAASATLLENFLVPAIRPPTVPPGSSRLRVTVSAAHTDDQVAGLAAALAEIAPS